MENQGAGFLADVILRQVAGASSAEISFGVRLRLWQVMLGAAAALVAVAGLIFAAALLVIYLADTMPLTDAVGWVAGGLFLIAISLGLICYLLTYRRWPGAAKSAGPAAPEATDIINLLCREIPRLVKEHPGKSLLGALAAGALVGYSPEVRSLLMEALKSWDKKAE
jgi:hypothetical protein